MMPHAEMVTVHSTLNGWGIFKMNDRRKTPPEPASVGELRREIEGLIDYAVEHGPKGHKKAIGLMLTEVAEQYQDKQIGPLFKGLE